MKILQLISLIILISYTFQNLTVVQYPKTDELDFSKPFSYTIADFGRIPYGVKTTSPLKLANPPDACTPLRHPVKHSDHKITEYDVESPVFLVERGNCMFVDKVINAQYAGAKAVIIMDNIEEYNVEIYMGDDGNGDFVSIPGLFITKDEGDYLKKAIDIQNGNPVFQEILVEIDFDLNMPPRGELTDVELFLNTPNFKNYELLYLLFEGLENYRLYEDFNITPNFEILSSRDDSPDCYNNGNTYCTQDQDGIEQVGTGAHLVEDYLVQLCIFKQEGFEVWQKYVEFQDAKCFQIAGYSHCRDDILYTLKLNKEDLYDCMKFDENWRNKELDIQLEKQFEYGLFSYPSVYINGSRYSGSLNGMDVLEAICSSNPRRSKACLGLMQEFKERFEQDPVEFYVQFLNDDTLAYVDPNNQNWAFEEEYEQENIDDGDSYDINNDPDSPDFGEEEGFRSSFGSDDSDDFSDFDDYWGEEEEGDI